MSERALGELCALLAPLVWSTAIVLYKKTDAPPLSMNLFKNALALVLLGLTMLALGIGFPRDRSAWAWGELVCSGLLGLSIADTLLFEGLRRVGASGIAISDTIYAPLVVALSALFLSETLSPPFLVGTALVVAGIGVATIRPSELRETGKMLRGLAYGLTAIACTATAVVLAKPVLDESDLLEVTFTRLGVGLVGQAIWMTFARRWSEGLATFRPTRTWRTLVPAAIVGTYVSMLLWLGGFKWAPASLAAVLNQMGTVYMLLQARFLLKESLRPAQVAGALMAGVGALWIMLHR